MALEASNGGWKPLEVQRPRKGLRAVPICPAASAFRDISISGPDGVTRDRRGRQRQAACGRDAFASLFDAFASTLMLAHLGQFLSHLGQQDRGRWLRWCRICDSFCRICDSQIAADLVDVDNAEWWTAVAALSHDEEAVTTCERAIEKHSLA